MRFIKKHNLNRIATWLVVVTLIAPVQAEETATIRIESVLVTILEKADVPARDAGLLTTLNVREGDLVEEGQVIAVLDNTVAKIERDRAAVELELAAEKATNDVKVRFAEKAFAVSQAELKRAQESVDKFRKAVSQTEMDRLKLTMEKTELEIEQAQREQQEAKLESRAKEHEARLADEVLKRRAIIAPISGVVVQVARSKGEWVQPGDAVLRIVRVDRLRAEGFADARQVNRHLAGRTVTLTTVVADEKPQAFTGKLVFISPEVNRFNRQVRVWAEIENPRLLLRPGVAATMTVSPAESPTNTAAAPSDTDKP